MFLARVKTAAAVLRRWGLRPLLTFVAYRAADWIWDRRLGIRTGGSYSPDLFGIHNSDCHEYGPTLRGEFRKAMKKVPLSECKDVFLDFGSGMGRMVIMAATYPFRKVIGVELVPELNEIARQNLERARPRLRCADVELVTCDATKFAIPPDVSVIFFNNPFEGEVLRSIFRDIRQSVDSHPRRVTIIYIKTEVFEREGLDREGMILRHDFSCFRRNKIYEVLPHKA